MKPSQFRCPGAVQCAADLSAFVVSVRTGDEIEQRGVSRAIQAHQRGVHAVQ
jgi:hypothetical protein